jgi:hypothetical protein
MQNLGFNEEEDFKKIKKLEGNTETKSKIMKIEMK